MAISHDYICIGNSLMFQNYMRKNTDISIDQTSVRASDCLDVCHVLTVGNHFNCDHRTHSQLLKTHLIMKTMWIFSFKDFILPLAYLRDTQNKKRMLF